VFLESARREPERKGKEAVRAGKTVIGTRVRIHLVSRLEESVLCRAPGGGRKVEKDINNGT
jgi:hypothetical protein